MPTRKRLTIPTSEIRRILSEHAEHALRHIPRNGEARLTWRWADACTWNTKVEILDGMIQSAMEQRKVARSEAITQLSEQLVISPRQLYRLLVKKPFPSSRQQT